MLPSTCILSLLAFTATALAAPSHKSKHAQTVYMAGDSTMARGNGVIVGWGVYFPYSVNIDVVNKAIGGRSSRSFSAEGRFDDIHDLVKKNDIVIIEFGHNDGGGLNPDNGRAVCSGDRNQTCEITVDDKTVTVYTFYHYLHKAGKKLIKKGAKVIISSQTPNNPWEHGSFEYNGGGRFVGYAKDVADALGDHAMYVDHSAYTADIFKTLGKDKTDALFVPGDHTHTNAEGADVVAKAFVKGLQCGGGGFLSDHIRNSTEDIPGTCL